MHKDEVRTDSVLVQQLVAGQFPQWADRAVTPVPSGGTDNAIYRLGDELAVRLPRIEAAVKQVEFEHEWLPVLARHLPVAVPQPCVVGRPAGGYPWSWAVYRWVDGEHPIEGNTDSHRFAADLGELVAGLRRADTTGARAGYRSGPLSGRDEFMREWTEAARGMVDVDAVISVWEASLAAPTWDGPPVWSHGDLLAGNVLVKDGRLCGLIDFGAAGVGDPACDAMAAWTLLDSDSRDVFGETAGFDDATWTRGKGWALTFISALTYYRETNPTMYAIAQRTVEAVLADPALTAVAQIGSTPRFPYGSEGRAARHAAVRSRGDDRNSAAARKHQHTRLLPAAHRGGRHRGDRAACRGVRPG